jgi:hypothetical protein
MWHDVVPLHNETCPLHDVPTEVFGRAYLEVWAAYCASVWDAGAGLSARLLRCRQGQGRALLHRHPHTHRPNNGSRSKQQLRLPDRPLDLILPPQTMAMR